MLYVLDCLLIDSILILARFSLLNLELEVYNSLHIYRPDQKMQRYYVQTPDSGPSKPVKTKAALDSDWTQIKHISKTKKQKPTGWVKAFLNANKPLHRLTLVQCQRVLERAKLMLARVDGRTKTTGKNPYPAR